jgi:hypothetical protein
MLQSASELSSLAHSVEPLNLWWLGMVAFMETQTTGAERLATCLTFFGMQITHVQATIAALSNAFSAALFALVVAGSRHDYVAGHKLSQGKKQHGIISALLCQFASPLWRRESLSHLLLICNEANPSIEAVPQGRLGGMRPAEIALCSGSSYIPVILNETRRQPSEVESLP